MIGKLWRMNVVHTWALGTKDKRRVARRRAVIDKISFIQIYLCFRYRFFRTFLSIQCPYSFERHYSTTLQSNTMSKKKPPPFITT